MIIEGYFEYAVHIAPACFDFLKNSFESYPMNGTKALVAGFGIIKVRKSLKIPENYFHAFVQLG